MPRKKEENLIPFSERTEREQREIAKKGGKRSGEVRKEKADMKKSLEWLLNEKLPDADIRKCISQQYNKAETKITVMDFIMYKAINKAGTGDIKAMEFVRDTIGQKPADKIEVNQMTAEGLEEIADFLNECAETDDFK